MGIAVALLAALSWMLPLISADGRDETMSNAVPARDADAVSAESEQKGGEGRTSARVEVIEGVPVLILGERIQRRSGIETETLVPFSYRPETRAFALVVDIQPLLQLRAGYAEAVTEKAIAAAALSASEQSYQRTRRLHTEELVATRKLEEARSQWLADKARLAAAEHRIRGLRENAVQEWGEPLASWALSDRSGPFERLIERREMLLLVSLDSGRSLVGEAKTIAVGRNGNRREAKAARLISPAPRTDTISQGETYYFRADTGDLRTGMRVDAWIPAVGDALSGVLIPNSAVVWQGGAPWCYIQSGEERFVRRPLTQPIETQDGWFVESGFLAGEKLVTVGGQMLLSEEFRRQIPDEDDD